MARRRPPIVARPLGHTDTKVTFEGHDSANAPRLRKELRRRRSSSSRSASALAHISTGYHSVSDTDRDGICATYAPKTVQIVCIPRTAKVEDPRKAAISGL